MAVKTANNVSVELEGLQAIDRMFKQLPKQVNQDAQWGKFWRVSTQDLLKAAEREAPLLDPGKTGRVGVAYPPNKKLTISRGTLKKSIKFYRTNASRQSWIHGAYIGPRVKGKFAKNKGGYFGAWVEYGHKLVHGGTTKANPYMQRAWKQQSRSVLSKGFKGAEKIFTSALKTHKNRLEKRGSLGY